jgi:hypothetical protein
MAREKTGKRVAGWAGEILALKPSRAAKLHFRRLLGVPWSYVEGVAASALTQREPKPRKNGRVALGPWKRRRNIAAKNRGK